MVCEFSLTLLFCKFSEVFNFPNFSGRQEAEQIWRDVEQQKREGAYPFTHLTHNQDQEVWIDPLRLPPDISS